MYRKSVILTAFRCSSSEMLLKDIGNYECLILPNDKVKDSEKLLNVIEQKRPDLIISFGQRPNIKNKVHIETTAKCGGEMIYTAFDCEELKQLFEQNGMVSQISYNAGTSYCNQLYFNVMQEIVQKGLNTKMVFIHIPYLKNISDFDEFRKQIFDTVSDIVSGN